MSALSNFVNPDEIKQFTQIDNRKGAWVFVKCWLITAAIFAGVALWTHPVSIVLAVILLGGRQLNLAIIMHDAGHQLLFDKPTWNIQLGNWFAAYFLLLNTTQYAKQHNHHHGLAGTDKDPDLNNFKAYPVSKQSFARKIARDLFGITAAKFIIGLVLNKTGLMEKDPQHYQTVAKGIVVNALFAGLLWSIGFLWLYGLWVAAFFTSYMLVLRIRQAAEHGAVANANDRDPRNHTRTTLTNLFERLVFAPAKVNYHTEHHLLPRVPCYRLPALHKLLLVRGYYQNIKPTAGYGVLMKELIS